ncbi:prepilin-type N-terminal cleavage/methylation domain-containing protein [Iamia majanohamensis]|uniref:Prepilin-type N-terminal cleavage/methylation domain-containing protein n=1 Tax=Iamia majanohamensis TaxID=467976 RepID=A0AAF0BVJ4_9ACTN|nr:prepilin-type N-terminal cleavage/methylation domain-containing protein [Iamia majanohamensis]WCO66835.1 prepilin-type N-terminal cleavage/methylation domain-containing protein [Iamia majanohamensis]
MLKHIHASDRWTDKSVGQKGFTLIELLVVIAILGVLAAVVILGVGALQDRGEEEACETETQSIQAAVVAYMTDNGGSVPSKSQLATGNYIETEPADVATELANVSISTATGSEGEVTVTPDSNGRC